MTHVLSHRGPDDAGIAVVRDCGAAVGMRRLSVLDIETGQQPIWNEDQTVCVVFNGEIYNFQELREQLHAAGHCFVSHHSDTEVLVHGYEEWGASIFGRLNGMFACAIVDRRNRSLVVARDRTGEKPLYIADLGPAGYAVGSELKALLIHPDLSREIDIVGLEHYLSYDYVLAPRTVLKRVRKLPAAHFAVITATGYETERYWTPSIDASPISPTEALAQLDQILDDAVRMRMVADVPIGLFLSGGVDSSTIGFYMARHSSHVNSFSIGFEEQSYDESPYARLAADVLGTSHHTEILSAGRVRDLVLRVPDILDEPMADSSILPTYLLSRFAREHVTVALGGDGSDELLMGYRAYQPLKVAWELDRLPAVIRRQIAGAARRSPDTVRGRGLRGVQFLRRLDEQPVDRLLNHLGSYKGNARWLLEASLQTTLPTSVCDEPRSTILEGLGPNMSGGDQTVVGYLRSYLQEDILVKVDRASMAASLEVRSPFLDPFLVDFALSLPQSLKMRGLTRKYLLRKLMRGRLPDALLDRPKKGFSVPMSAWLRGPLREALVDYLEPRRIAAEGLFDPHSVSSLVEEHLTGVRDRGSELWLLLHFQLWRERWLDTPSVGIEPPIAVAV